MTEERAPLLIRSWRTPTLERDLRDAGPMFGEPEEVLRGIPERLWIRIDDAGVALLRAETGPVVLQIPAERITNLAVAAGDRPRHEERVLNGLDRWAMMFTWGMGRVTWPRLVVRVKRDDGTIAELHLPATDTLGVSKWAGRFRPRNWPTLRRAEW